MTDTHTLRVCDTCKYHLELHKLCYTCFDDKGYRTNWDNKNKTYTNYDRYFGTPEKTIDTIMTVHYVCETDGCAACPYPSYKCNDEDAMIEWLNTEEE